MVLQRPLRAGLLCLLLLVLGPSASVASQGAWRDVAEQAIQGLSERRIVPTRYRTLALDRDAMGEALGRAPRDAGPLTIRDGEVIHLPLPDGGSARFLVKESPIMEPELAAKYPQIRTYRGQGLDDPSATLRLDRTPSGLHAMILSASGSVFIDPYQRHDSVHHISYYKQDLANPHGDALRCRFDDSYRQDSPQSGAGFESAFAAEGLPSGSLLRTYRTAVATTAEYTQFHGNTVADGLAAVVTAMNRVNGIYERDVAIRMILVANNDLLISTNRGQDGYTNNSGFQMLDQNQDNLDTVIGNGNYDIGHVFSTGGGGVAYLGVACNPGFKAGGVTGLPSPIGDPFYVDFVAHELGHQWGADHSFNGNEGSCSGGNRSASTAYEPGSASTIMGYAGICGSQNLQSNSDAYFHTTSYEEIVNFSRFGTGNSCAAISATGNSAPVVEAGLSYTIPVDTPFTLCGSAVDPEGDPLTYAWEQFDLGPAGHPDFPVGDAPIFRSFNPGEDPCRNFPRLPDLAGGTSTIGDLLPSYARTLNFRLTARDNRSGGGGSDYDTTTVDVINTTGPFQVTAPDGSAVWNGAQLQPVTWDVAGTNAAPISCSHVDILFSQDGGNTFPFTLLGGTPNDGSQQVPTPNLSTSQARVSVRCSDNLFFNISPADFTIVETAGVMVGSVQTLFVNVAPGGDFLLDWSFSCVTSDADYEIYQGSFDDFTSYAPLACSTGGNTSFTVSGTPETAFYLIVPRKIVQEGGYGQDSLGALRPASAAACLPQLNVGCP